jgi:hypothetical protein
MHRRPLPSARASAPRPALAAAAALSALLLLSAVLGAAAPAALADDPAPAGPAPACVPPPQRLAALEHEIRHLERLLQGLRRARADAAAGRSEAFPADAAAVRAAEAAQKVLRELQRYESARARALAHLSKACADGDARKAGEARAELAALDEAFVAAMGEAEAKDRPDPAPPTPPAPPKRPRGKREPSGDDERPTGSGATR